MTLAKLSGNWSQTLDAAVSSAASPSGSKTSAVSTSWRQSRNSSRLMPTAAMTSAIFKDCATASAERWIV